MTEIDKTLLKDKMGRPLTQSLFLELGYNTEYALYTLGEYNGKMYPSLKRLYLECGDPTEYEFAKRYLLSYKHWVRLQENKSIIPYIEEWRDELEVAIRSAAIFGIMDQASGENGYQANKWLADRGWIKRAAGRPSKEEKKKDQAIRNRIIDEFNEDSERLSTIQ